ERLIVIEPKGEWPDHMKLDSAVCAAGLKRFVRPVLASDLGGVEAFGADHMAVMEVTKGVRARRPLMVTWNESEVGHA
ncbi:MAG: hypothetical protein ACLQGP_39475, partial [Isosphaeraceae bacterium]